MSETSQPKITMGRAVFYVKTTGLIRSAWVTLVHDDGTVNLTVFDSDGSTFGVGRVSYCEKPKSNSWHWPPRV